MTISHPGAIMAPASEPDEAQAAFLAALVELAAAERKAHDLSHQLPPLTPAIVANATTAWCDTPAQIVEVGYCRWTDLADLHDDDPDVYGPATWHATTDGWDDDYSESGAVEYVEVDGLPYATPEDLDYD